MVARKQSVKTSMRTFEVHSSEEETWRHVRIGEQISIQKFGQVLLSRMSAGSYLHFPLGKGVLVYQKLHPLPSKIFKCNIFAKFAGLEPVSFAHSVTLKQSKQK